MWPLIFIPLKFVKSINHLSTDIVKKEAADVENDQVVIKQSDILWFLRIAIPIYAGVKYSGKYILYISGFHTLLILGNLLVLFCDGDLISL